MVNQLNAIRQHLGQLDAANPESALLHEKAQDLQRLLDQIPEKA